MIDSSVQKNAEDALIVAITRLKKHFGDTVSVEVMAHYASTILLAHQLESLDSRINEIGILLEKHLTPTPVEIKGHPGVGL